MRTVVLGGYGNFGARICRALGRCADIDLVIAGRDKERAEMFAAELGARTRGARIDISCPDLAQQLRSLGAELVIHTAGPFQQQGYEVPLAVAAAGAHYIDLADGRRFVCDFPRKLDTAFRRQDKTAITGASTVPALSTAVVDELTKGWQGIQTINFCIAPAQSAPRGVTTLAAILNYCGAPIEVWENGRWQTRYGWAAPARVEFLRLRPRLGSLCDIPDLELLPERYPGVQNVMFRAALEIGLTQRALAFVAGFRRARLVRRPERYAKLFHRVANGLNGFGSSLGGMAVSVSGRGANGESTRCEWHIAADDDHGPEIPCMAAILLAERLACGELNLPGAHTSMGTLALADFEPEFARWNMITDIVPGVNAHGA
ncbi:saccharopine dehydrogenase family protein [Noviherbaspirillum saxi]|uniref:Saccharopine dehydrogenase n=1 Tax=Noviherbaspirillum saxi TaxID=2320863 RepID=A0A3A3FKF0_9BURK|nr:saccharopine dehydrogenase NADP-binding domain-containing protein [Noviherbaspirillum saxi]RJF95963.1 saccharopine dehydrogenase [Noviherbaspirillum saxi]